MGKLCLFLANHLPLFVQYPQIKNFSLLGFIQINVDGVHVVVLRHNALHHGLFLVNDIRHASRTRGNLHGYFFMPDTKGPERCQKAKSND